MQIKLIDEEVLNNIERTLTELQKFLQQSSQNQQNKNAPEKIWEYYTLDEALQLLGIKKKTWYKNYRNTTPKVIPFSKYGDKVWIKKSDLENFLKSRRIQ